MNDRKRLLLMKDVYTAVLVSTETFRGRVGADLAYLLGAIASVGDDKKKCAFSPRSRIVKILKAHFSEDHTVWSFIDLTS